MSYETEKIKILHLLHANDVWNEELLSRKLFGKEYRLLRPTEVFVLEEKIVGKSDKAIGKCMKVDTETIKRYCYNIKQVLRNKQRVSPDNVRYR